MAGAPVAGPLTPRTNNMTLWSCGSCGPLVLWSGDLVRGPAAQNAQGGSKPPALWQKRLFAFGATAQPYGLGSSVSLARHKITQSANDAMIDTPKTVKGCCPTCGGEWNCLVRACHEIKTKVDLRTGTEAAGTGADQYMILECCGCEAILFRKYSYLGEWGYSSWNTGQRPPTARRQIG
jgi:hypothetical protein